MGGRGIDFSRDVVLCESGRTAWFVGPPCEEAAIHFITSPGETPLKFCHKHFQQILAAGFVTEPYLTQEEYDRREREQLGVKEIVSGSSATSVGKDCTSP